MERLTKRNKGKAYLPYCFKECGWDGSDPECSRCRFNDKIVEKLAEYEDLEENGLLLRLPCRMGDAVYAVYKKSQNEIEYDIDCFSFDIDYIDEIGKTVFLTQAEAEAKLKEMEVENESDKMHWRRSRFMHKMQR